MTKTARDDSAGGAGSAAPTNDNGLAMLAHIPVRLTVEVGAAALTVAELLALGPDAMVPLDRQADDPLDILVNGALIARGEVVTVDGRYGVRITEIVAPGMMGKPA